MTKGQCSITVRAEVRLGEHDVAQLWEASFHYCNTLLDNNGNRDNSNEFRRTSDLGLQTDSDLHEIRGEF